AVDGVGGERERATRVGHPELRQREPVEPLLGDHRDRATPCRARRELGAAGAPASDRHEDVARLDRARVVADAARDHRAVAPQLRADGAREVGELHRRAPSRRGAGTTAPAAVTAPLRAAGWPSASTTTGSCQTGASSTTRTRVPTGAISPAAGACAVT